MCMIASLNQLGRIPMIYLACSSARFLALVGRGDADVAGGLLHNAAPLCPPCVRLADLRAGVRLGRAGAAAACARLGGSVGRATGAYHLSAAARWRAGRQARAGLADGDGLVVQPADARAHALAHLVHAALRVRRTAAAASPARL
eukprot:scaffold5098_cov56-Phaeocystis_antarctica.AAC.1